MARKKNEMVSKSVKTAKVGEKLNEKSKLSLEELSAKIISSDEKPKNTLDDLANGILNSKNGSKDDLDDLASKILSSKGNDIDDNDIDNDIDIDNEIIIEGDVVIGDCIEDEKVLGEDLIKFLEVVIEEVEDEVIEDVDINDNTSEVTVFEDTFEEIVELYGEINSETDTDIEPEPEPENDIIEEEIVSLDSTTIEIIDEDGDIIEIEFPTKEFLQEEIEKLDTNIKKLEGEDEEFTTEDENEIIENNIILAEEEEEETESFIERDPNTRFIVNDFIYQSTTTTDNGTYELFEKHDKLLTTRKYIKLEKLTKFILHMPKIVTNYNYFISVTDTPFNIYFNGNLLLDFYKANSSVDFTIDGLLFLGKLFPYSNLEFVKI